MGACGGEGALPPATVINIQRFEDPHGGGNLEDDVADLGLDVE
jgi:hypothetical protein